jgi:phosphate/sulfate permease
MNSLLLSTLVLFVTTPLRRPLSKSIGFVRLLIGLNVTQMVLPEGPLEHRRVVVFSGAIWVLFWVLSPQTLGCPHLFMLKFVLRFML